MTLFTQRLPRRARPVNQAAAFAAATSISALFFVAAHTAHAQPAVVYVVNGQMVNQDYFGGGGVQEFVLPTTTGDNLSFSQTLFNPPGTSETRLSFSSAVSSNTGTFSSSYSSLAQRTYSSGPEFFIYYNSSSISVDAYILGGAGTAYESTTTATGYNDSINGGAGSYQANASSFGQSYPGFAYTFPTAGGTYSETGFSSGTLLTYMGSTYSRVGPGPNGGSSAYFGITGTPDAPGYTRMSAGQSFTFTVVNSSITPSAAPEPGTLVLTALGLIGGALLWLQKRRALVLARWYFFILDEHPRSARRRFLREKGKTAFAESTGSGKEKF